MADYLLEFDPQTTAEGLGVELSDIFEVMQGGTASPILKRRILAVYCLDKIGGQGGFQKGDGRSDEGLVVIRGITVNGVNLVPAKYIGIERKVMWDILSHAFDDKTGGFIFHDNTKFPHVPCWHISQDQVKEWLDDGQLNSKGIIPYNKIIELLG